jgi:2-phospho-L-lactate guanylyltransferase
MRTVLLPVKDFANAKQRLATVLSPAQRAGLARSMLMDVLEAISHASLPETVIVFTASEEVAEIVRGYRFEVVHETAVRGHSAAVNQMVNALQDRATHILSIAGDLPTLQATDVDTVFADGGSGICLVPSRDGTGTNAALFVRPARIQMDYGEGSLKRHRSIAAAAGFPANIMHIPGIEFDIDTLEDLQFFRESSLQDSHTRRFAALL